MQTTAFLSGFSDGATQVNDFSPTAEEVESWFFPGKLNPDEELINNCTTPRLAMVLGLTVTQVELRGDDWDDAIEAYNRGYRTGAREAVR